eukprot:3681417-Amphidinium_carterae.1
MARRIIPKAASASLARINSPGRGRQISCSAKSPPKRLWRGFAAERPTVRRCFRGKNTSSKRTERGCNSVEQLINTIGKSSKFNKRTPSGKARHEMARELPEPLVAPPEDDDLAPFAPPEEPDVQRQRRAIVSVQKHQIGGKNPRSLTDVCRVQARSLTLSYIT